jgi:hypothetical protein
VHTSSEEDTLLLEYVEEPDFIWVIVGLFSGSSRVWVISRGGRGGEVGDQRPDPCVDCVDCVFVLVGR